MTDEVVTYFAANKYIWRKTKSALKMTVKGANSSQREGRVIYGHLDLDMNSLWHAIHALTFKSIHKLKLP